MENLQQFTSLLKLSSNFSSSSSSFQSLSDLPVILSDTQCVRGIVPEELLICGGYNNGNCYSYHTLKNEYKLICNYPSYVSSSLWGHAVCRYDSNSTINKNFKQKYKQKQKSIILFSVGGQKRDKEKYTLMMTYQSVWNEDEKKITKNHKNQWVHAPFHIGNTEDDMEDVRMLIGGSKNHLLFVLYKYIDVIDLNSFDHITKRKLPFLFDYGCCFLNLDIDSNHMILFARDTGVSIKYHEKKSSFAFNNLPICCELQYVRRYAYIYLNDMIILFGGYHAAEHRSSNKVYLYSVKKKEWRESPHKLPISLYASFAILDHDNKWVHIIGGSSENEPCKYHWKIRVRELLGLALPEMKIILGYWVQENKIRKGWIVEFDVIIANYISDVLYKPEKKKKRINRLALNMLAT